MKKATLGVVWQGFLAIVVTSSPLKGISQLQHDVALNHGAKHHLSMLRVDQKLKMKPPEGVRTIEHEKEANGGYVKGSPLYNKQEGIEQKPDDPTPVHEAVKETEDDTGIDVTSSQDPQVPIARVAMWETVIYILVYVILVLSFAYARSKRLWQPAGERTSKDSRVQLPAWTKCGFGYSFCDCGNLNTDWMICLTSLCCPIIQWADTTSRSAKPLMSYWRSVIILLVMVVLAPFTFGMTLIVVAVLVYLRRRHLRETYGHTMSPTTSMLQDGCLVCCCSDFLCCQLVQEAREVEFTSPSTGLP
jgi:hypothetical protein